MKSANHVKWRPTHETDRTNERIERTNWDWNIPQQFEEKGLYTNGWKTENWDFICFAIYSSERCNKVAVIWVDCTHIGTNKFIIARVKSQIIQMARMSQVIFQFQTIIWFNRIVISPQPLAASSSKWHERTHASESNQILFNLLASMHIHFSIYWWIRNWLKRTKWLNHTNYFSNKCCWDAGPRKPYFISV